MNAISPIGGSPSRKAELPWLNLAFCAMVLGSHCSGDPIVRLNDQSWQFALVYLLQRLSFVSVYGFFLLAGVKLTLPRKTRVRPIVYYRGRVRSILLPYCIACAVYYFYFTFVRPYYAFSPVRFLWMTASGTMSAPFYFIVALAQFVLLMPLLRAVAERVSPIFSLPLALGITWASELYFADFIRLFRPESAFPFGDRVFTTYLFYYLAGCYIGLHYEAFVEALKKNRAFICASFGLLAAADLILSYRSRVLGLWSPLVSWAHFLYLPCAIAFCFLIATQIRRPLPRFLALVEKASFLIYLYHALVIHIADELFAAAGITGIGAQYALRLLIVFILVPLGCIAWQKLYGRAKQALRQTNLRGAS